MRTICLDLRGEKRPLDRFFSHCVGAGRAGELMRAAALDQLSVLQEECGFSYLRFHGLLCDDMAVYAEDRDGQPIYNWQYVDLVFDAMLARHIRPLVELGFTPDALKSGPETLFWWRGNTTPPASLEKWSALITAIVRHWTARYGRDEVRQWYFEIWNEPNLTGFFHGTQSQYFALYDATAAAVKAVDPAYRVGGPATAGVPGNTWVSEMIAHCEESGAPLDFITTHSYGVEGALDEFGRDRHRLRKPEDCIAREVRAVREQVRASARPELPVFFTEWNSSYTSRDPVHDSYVNAAFVLYTLKRCAGAAQSMSYWTFTDIFEEAGPGLAPFHGGFGLMNIQGLKKPTYHAYHWLCALPDTELETGDSDSLAAMDDRSVQALLWRYVLPEQDADNEEYFTRDLPAKESEPITVRIDGLAPGRYTLERYRTGYMANDVYTLALQAGLIDLKGRETPTREQIAALADQTGGAPEAISAVNVGADGRAETIVSMRENDVVRLVLRREG